MNRRCNYKHNHHNLQQSDMFLPIMICSRSSVKDVKLSHCRRRSSDDPPSPKFRFSAPPKRNSKVSGIPTPNHHSLDSSAAITARHAAPIRNINTVKHHSLGRLFSGIPTPNHHSLDSSAAITARHAAPIRNINTVKYHSLGRLFSAKSLTKKSTTTTTDSATVSRSEMLIKQGYLRNYTCHIRSECGDHHRGKTRVDLDVKAAKTIDVAELDPPLPVVRRPAQRKPESGSGGEERENLWKRRSRGSALGSLQVQSIIHGGATSLHTVPANTV